MTKQGVTKRKVNVRVGLIHGGWWREMGDQPTKGQTRTNCKKSKWVTNQKESKCESGTICKEDEREMGDQPRGTKS